MLESQLNADTNETLVGKVGTKEWGLAGSSGIDYNPSKIYWIANSLRGVELSGLEIAGIPAGTMNYNDRQVAAIHRDIVQNNWVIIENNRLGSDAFFTMLASEKVLRKDWDSPEEDKAWQDL